MADATSLIGRTIAGRYCIEELVGGGAMGDVYRARHVGLGSEVAIKILRPSIAEQTNFKERFIREAKTASRLDHANSVRVLDFGQEDDGLSYLVMEFLRGSDLRRVVDTEWPLTDARIVDMLSQTLAAMATAHELGIIHRDLKPENIMIVSDGEAERLVKVCDFGIAKLIDARAYKSAEDVKTALTSGNALIGTPEYMSPEQARGEPLDARSDLYSVGVILYLMLARRLPFEGESMLGIAVKHLTEEPVPPSEHVATVNARLEAVCLRALRKDPNERPATAKEMRAELRAALDGVPMPASSTSLVGARPSLESDEVKSLAGELGLVPTGSGSRRWLIGGAVIGLLAIAGGALAWSQRREEPTPVVVALSASSAPVPPRVTASARPADPPRSKGKTAASTASTTPPVVDARSDGTDEASEEPSEESAVDGTAPRTEARVRPGGAKKGAHRLGRTPAPAKSPRPSVPTLPPSPPAETTEPAEVPTHAPPYKPSNALVARESLFAERVRREVVDRKLSELAPQLNDCYRDALFITGTAVGGRASIHLSIDPSGHVVGIVTAPQLPSFQRCAGRLVASLSIPTDAVDSGGGTAEQILRLTP